VFASIGWRALGQMSRIESSMSVTAVTTSSREKPKCVLAGDEDSALPGRTGWRGSAYNNSTRIHRPTLAISFSCLIGGMDAGL